jgi:hypothetical protein
MSQITPGNILTVTLGALTAVGMFFITEARSQSNLNDIDEIKLEYSALENRTRVVENELARADERFGSILSLLSKIDLRLERFELKR